MPGAPPNAGSGSLQTRIQQATDQAAASGATLSVGILDRKTHELISNGNTQIIGTASVAKLFIADDLLLQEAQGKTTLSPSDRQALDVMLQSSDDGAAEKFWDQGGGDNIISQVASRYGLASTTPPSDGRWWNTMSSLTDVIYYYDKLLDGAGGLPAERAKIIVNDLAQSTPNGIDGYPQRFGIPDGLFAEPVAVKQGWMCCIGTEWMHLSTGVVGADRRYIVVVESLQSSDDATARADDHPGGQNDVPQRPDRAHNLLSAGRIARLEIGAAIAGALQRNLPAPGGNARMIAGQQNLGDLEVPPARRPGVAGPLQQTLEHRRVRILAMRRRIAQNAGHQPQYGLDHHNGRGLAARQHIVADRNFFDPHPPTGILDDALVDALVAAAGEHQVFLGAPALGGCLGEQLTGGARNNQ